MHQSDRSKPVQIHSGRLLWSGEHWINALQPQGAETPSAWVSLFHTRYSPAGEGNTAQIIIRAQKQLSLVCMDDPEVGKFTQENFLVRSSFQDPEAPVVKAHFFREGDIRKDPAWVIETDEHRIVARWRVTEPPVIAHGTFRPGTEHFTVLFFIAEASVEVDGQLIPGKPYFRDIWKPQLPGDRSSCVFALAETLIEFPKSS